MSYATHLSPRSTTPSTDGHQYHYRKISAMVNSRAKASPGTRSKATSVGTANTKIGFTVHTVGQPSGTFSPFKTSSATTSKTSAPPSSGDTTWPQSAPRRPKRPPSGILSGIDTSAGFSTVSTQPFPSIYTPVVRNHTEDEGGEKISGVTLVSFTTYRPANEYAQTPLHAQKKSTPRIEHPYYTEVAHKQFAMLMSTLTPQERVFNVYDDIIANLLCDRYILPSTLTDNSVRCRGCNNWLVIGKDYDRKKPEDVTRKFNTADWHHHRSACIGIQSLILDGDHAYPKNYTPRVSCRGCWKEIDIPPVEFLGPPGSRNRPASEWQEHKDICDKLHKLLRYERKNKIGYRGTAMRRCGYGCDLTLTVDGVDPQKPYNERAVPVSEEYQHFQVCPMRKKKLKEDERAAAKARQPGGSSALGERIRKLSDASVKPIQRIRRLSDAGKDKIKGWLGKSDN